MLYYKLTSDGLKVFFYIDNLLKFKAISKALGSLKSILVLPIIDIIKFSFLMFIVYPPSCHKEPPVV